MAIPECILIVVDPGADRHPAVERGMFLAEHLGMRVDLFICDYNAYLVGGLILDAARLKKAKSGFLDDKKKFLDGIAEPYQKRGIEVAVKVAWDRPLHEGIVRQALQSDARFVVKDTHYHSALSRVLITNTDWHLIRTCPSPLWLVRSDHEYSSPRILAAVDPLHEHDKPASLDVRILSEAFEIGDALGGEVHIAHAFNPYLDPGDPDRIEQQHAEALEKLAGQLQVPAERMHMHAGNPTDLLPKISGDVGADLVIMGAIARSRLENAIVGSTAENVLDQLGCDVLVIKPKGFISPVTFRAKPKGAVLAR